MIIEDFYIKLKISLLTRLKEVTNIGGDKYYHYDGISFCQIKIFLETFVSGNNW
jgi:hypothetical protein